MLSTSTRVPLVGFVNNERFWNAFSHHVPRRQAVVLVLVLVVAFLVSVISIVIIIIVIVVVAIERPLEQARA